MKHTPIIISEEDTIASQDLPLILNKDLWCVGIHGQTGRPVDQGTLVAGALLRNLSSGIDDAGSPVFSFEVQTTDCGYWWRCQSSERPEAFTQYRD